MKKKAEHKIKCLSDDVANLIAAGEVVERPASVVKELVENAVDANARSIIVVLEEAGMKCVRVADDGEGMSSSDVKMAFSRHATSKIRSAGDLDSIRTFGFRGEALPSIAAVSRIDVKTRTADMETGYSLVLEGGKITSEKPVACNRGTDFFVRDLFFNTPARKAFMKSMTTEQIHAIQTVELAALANLKIRFQLTVDDREIFHCPATKDIRERLYSVYGKTLPKELLEVAHEAGGIWMRGCIGGVGDHKNTRQSMRFFINQRPVEHRGLAHAVLQAYRNLIPEGRFPFAYLFFEMPGHLVDVNVHPAKREVRLRDEKAMHHFVFQALQNLLRESDLSGGRVLGLTHPEKREPINSASNEPSLNLGWSEQRVRESVAAYHLRTTNSGTEREAERVDGSISFPEESNQALRIIGQVGRTYIAAQDDEGFMLVDQHAAHERIVYEKLIEEKASSDVPRQNLLLPLTLDCTAAQSAVLEKHLHAFDDLGIEISPFGKNTFTVRTQPKQFGGHSIVELILEMVDWIIETGRKTDPLKIREKILHQVACKSAVKAGERLQPEIMLAIVRDALSIQGLPTCPHGRPFLFRLKWNELDKIFKRDYAS